MSTDTETLPDHDSPAAASGWRPDLLRDQLADLEELRKASLALAQDIQRRSGEVEPGQMVPPISLGLAGRIFDRVARAMRLTVMLETKLADQLAALERGETVEDTASGPTRRPTSAASPPETDRSPRERLLRETVERLDEDHFGELLERPVEDVIAIIHELLDIGMEDLVPVEGGPARSPPSTAGSLATTAFEAGATVAPHARSP